MNAIQLLLVSVGFFGLGAAASLILMRSRAAARAVGGLAGAIASAAGLVAAIQAAIRPPAALNLSDALPFGALSFQMDGLSALMVGMICLVSLAVSLYSISYTGAEKDQNDGLLGFFTSLFVAMMLLVVTVSNTFYFLVFWEMMTLVSYFLVSFRSGEEGAVRAGYLYMVIAHAGGALIMVAFLIFFIETGSFDFSAIRQAPLSPVLRDVVFLLAFVGFGAKAGIVPLHFWMPSAYAAAPSSSAALMASVMKKTAIYGILRFCVDLLGGGVLWWGTLIVLFGIASVVFGALFALAEKDIKRILAYSSIENVGIILMGIGIGLIGLATQQPAVALIGFLAALYHALNHSFFKGLLFLSAGTLDGQLGTSNLNQMGGLARRMPWTALAFLIGALGAAAIPPFNGFVSEWFTYQALFTGSMGEDFGVRALLPLCAVLLALGGTLAAMVATKMYAGAFTGPAKSNAAGEAAEVPGPMLIGMGLLAIGCIAFGLGAPLVTRYLAGVISNTFGLAGLTASSGTWVYAADPARGLLSMPMVALLLLGFLLVPVLLVGFFGGRKAGGRVVRDPWACGYGYSREMSVSASSFDQPVGVTFNALYRLRAALLKPVSAVGAWAKRPRDAISRAEPVLETIIREPTTRAVEYLGQHIQALQMGDIRVYCFYIILTLALLLIVMFR